MSDEETYSSGLSVTLKASEGFDAPWIVIHAQTVAEARATLMELNESDLMQGVAAVAAKFQSHFQQKPRYQSKSGGGRNSGGSASNPAAPPPVTASASSTSSPSPAFVPNQNAQPADWGEPVQALQQELGATVVAQVPNEVAYCADHGNAPRQYNEPGRRRSDNKEYSASYRCQIDGCPAYWQQQDGSWQRAKRR